MDKKEWKVIDDLKSKVQQISEQQNMQKKLANPQSLGHFAKMQNNSAHVIMVVGSKHLPTQAVD